MSVIPDAYLGLWSHYCCVEPRVSHQKPSDILGLVLTIILFSTEDWSLTVKGGTTPDKVQSSMEKWLSGKMPILINLQMG